MLEKQVQSLDQRLASLHEEIDSQPPPNDTRDLELAAERLQQQQDALVAQLGALNSAPTRPPDGIWSTLCGIWNADPSWRGRTEFLWVVTLFVMSISLLVTVIIARRARKTLGPVVMWCAGAACATYVAGHLFMFVREVQN